MEERLEGAGQSKGGDKGRSATHGIEEYEHAIREEGRLIGFACSCGFRTVTHILRCPKCGGADIAETTLATKGRIISFTVANMSSELFSKDVPFGYAIVEMDDGSRISAWMPGVKSADGIRIGERVCWKPSYRQGLVIEKEDQQ
jgi:uncharacterized OB-fold protein